MLKLLSRILNKAGRLAIESARLVDKATTPQVEVNVVESADKIIYNEIPEIRPLPAKFSNEIEPRVVLLLPSLVPWGFYGGIATALLVGAKVALINKRRLLIVPTVTSGYTDKDKIISFYGSKEIDVSNLDISILDVADRDGMHNDERLLVNKLDIFVASAWTDAWLINKLHLHHKFLYIIQDYEPIFYANSDRFIMAENTYRYDSYIPLCNTKLMHLNMVAKEYPAFLEFPYWFEPAVSNIKSGVATRNEKKNIFLYGRPSVARNLFYSVIAALKHIFENNFLAPNEWNVFMAGQDNLPTIEIGRGCNIVNLGKMDIDAYIKFSKSIDVAISLMMAPHPNYPTLEFASIGSAVVTTKYEVKKDLSFYSKNIFIADLNLESIIDNIVKAANMPYETRISNLQNNNIESDWNTALDKVINNISPEFTQLSNHYKS